MLHYSPFWLTGAEILTTGIETIGGPCKSGFITCPTNTMVSALVSWIRNRNGLLASKTASTALPNLLPNSTSKNIIYKNNKNWKLIIM